MDVFILLSIFVKFTFYVGLLFSAGTIFYTVLFENEAVKLYFPSQRWFILFTAVAVLSALVMHGLRAASLTGEWGSMVDPEMLGILWQTPVGAVLVLRMVGFALMLLGVLIGGFGHAVSFIVSVVALASLSQIGHVTSIEGVGFFPLILLLVHLIAVSLWLGILLPLHRLCGNDNNISLATIIADQFGKLAIFFVPILLFVGVGLAYFLVGSFSHLFDTYYGQVLLLKIVLVVVLLGMAAINKLRFVPALKMGDVTALAKLKSSIRIEITLFLLIFFVTAVLTTTLALP